MRAVAWLLPFVLLAGAARAQLIPSGSPVPRTTLPPVVFINGFQFAGCPTSFADTFGIADQVLQANGEVSLFFNTCSLPATASIEDLGAAFGTFLAGLKYTDGTPVEQVDVVAHSMGGLVLRCYLSGKQNTSGTFQPPAATHIRKAVFLATPHFGTPIAELLPVVKQVNEMSGGSEFLFDLATWNDAADDLHGVDAVAAAGNGGTGLLTQTIGFDDGVVPLTSASLRFYLPGRTRVVPYCHTSGGGLVSDVGLCPSNAIGIADIDSASHLSAQIIVSFFDGTSAWQGIGTAAEDNPFLSVDGGLIVAADNVNGSKLNIGSVTANGSKLGNSSDNLAFTDMITAGTIALTVTSGTTNISSSIALPAGGSEPYTAKPGPLIARVFPAAAAAFPLELAPRMLISIYGTGLAYGAALVNGAAIPLTYVSDTQINAVLPADLSGLIQLTVQNSAGQHAVNLYAGTAAPAIFTQDSSGTGPAAALVAPQLTLVTANNPLHPGDAVALYLTGLGATTPVKGLDVAVQQPMVTVEGLDCPVTFAGAAPGYIGLDQINCTIPANATSNASAPVVVTSGDRISNTATLAIQ
jgi:uncharacterized protein (TIGR03437 family)